MATVTEKPQPPKPPQPAEQQLVDQQISRTRRALKSVDVAAGLITLAIGVLAFLLTMSVLEHWVVPGGWSESARFVLFAVLIAGCVWYSWRKFWPLIRQPINPIYAAQAIEQNSPTLKNSLLNLLLLRNDKRRMSRQVYQAIEDQAAQGLSQVRMETVVDRSIILRLGYILVALTAVCVLYRVLSPKDLFSSAGRVLLPWSNIATPSRVSINEVTPGDTRVARGEQLKVTAEILGLETDEPVQLLYTTADKQIVGQAIPMTGSDSGTLFSCKVPAHIGGDRRGVQQDFTYWIEAGDARSARYDVNVFARPTLVVSRLRYEYPTYTGFPSREVEHTGDIRAVEGTRVTLFAEANKPIKSAHVDFEADGRHDLLMNSTEQQATVTFPLKLREDRRTPEHRSYVLKYTTTDGTRNQLPPKYQIDVQPDYAPEIQLLLPEEPMLEVAVNKEINFELEARDPDFALQQVFLVGKVGEEQRVQEPLLERRHTGKFVGKLRKTPEQLGLKPGDVLEYWGAASDNRRPEPNMAYSAHRKIRVVGPWQGNDQGDQNQEGEGQQQQGEGGDSQDGEGGQEGQAGGGEQGNSSEGEGQDGAEGQSGEGQQGGEPGENNQQQNGGQAGSEGEQDGEQEQQGGANGNSPNDNSQDRDGNEGDQQNSGEQNQDGQPNEDSSGGQGGEQNKVSPDGDDDSEAFERMKEHFDEQNGESGKGGGDPNQEQSGQAGESGNEANGEQSSGKQGAEQDRQSEGEGAQGDPAAGEEKSEGQGEQQQQEGESPDGNMSSEQGEAGAGDQKGSQQGAPNSDDANQPQDKQGDHAEGPSEENGEAGSETTDSNESDSEGGESGDRSGGGQEGAGQQADESGKGAAGQNEAAEDGAGKSSEQGEGETGQQAGDQDKAAGETGESSGDQQGQGSEQGQQPGEQAGGEQPGEGQSGQSGEQSNESPKNEGEAGEQGDQQPPKGQPPEGDESDSADNPSDGGDPAGSGGQSGTQQQSELLPQDKANLDYAKKQTDLILERLEDQLKKKEVDKNLLDKLGWSKDELRRFVDRWKNLKEQASDDTGASDELSDALRSLGLKRNGRTGYNSKVTKDQLRNLQEAYRGKVPLEYQDQVNRYLKGTANAQESE